MYLAQILNDPQVSRVLGSHVLSSVASVPDVAALASALAVVAACHLVAVLVRFWCHCRGTAWLVTVAD